MLESPLEIPIPPDPLERIHAFARDLAYGAALNLWPSTIEVRLLDGGQSEVYFVTSDEAVAQFDSMVREKWQSKSNSFHVLHAFGYVNPVGMIHPDQNTYYLTQKAFTLLERPAIPPSAFISYSRKGSSTFGLLIECRLRSAGIRAFIDRSLDPGEGWHNQLEEHVRQCNRFIILLAKNTLQSPYCSEEIRWAMDLNILTIPLWQPDFDPNESPLSTDVRDFVLSRHSIRVLEESAESYYNATEALLNRLGYSGV